MRAFRWPLEGISFRRRPRRHPPDACSSPSATELTALLGAIHGYQQSRTQVA
jgi:hypothetical protein